MEDQNSFQKQNNHKIMISLKGKDQINGSKYLEKGDLIQFVGAKNISEFADVFEHMPFSPNPENPEDDSVFIIPRIGIQIKRLSLFMFQGFYTDPLPGDPDHRVKWILRICGSEHCGRIIELSDSLFQYLDFQKIS